MQILKSFFTAIGLGVLCFAPTGAVYAFTCTSTGSTNWGTAATWTGCNAGIPGAGDAVVIAAGHSVTVNLAAVCNTLSTSGTSSSGVVISGGNSLTVSGNAVLDATGVNNNNSKSIAVGAGTLNIGGDLTITNGAGNRTAVLSMTTGTSNIGGSLSNGGMLTPGTGTVVFNGTGAQNIAGYTYNNLTVSKSTGTATLTASATINANLTVSAGTLDLSTFTADRATAGGVITVASGATLKIGGTNTFPANYTTSTLGATSVVDYSGSSQTVSNQAYAFLNLSGSGTKTLTGAMTIANDLTLAGTATANTGAAVTVNGNLTIAAGTTFLGNSFTHNLKGNLSNSGTLTGGTSTINFNGTAAQSISGAGATNFFGLTINNATGVTANGPINVQGNFTNTAGFAAGTNTVTFNGSSAQSLTGTTTFNNLTMNNAAGLSITSNVSVGGVLTFTSGNISTSANVLSITSTGSVSRVSGHVVGRLSKNVATGTNVTRTFEIGTGADYTPVQVTFDTVTVAGNLTATVATPDHPQIATSGINPARSVNRYWTLSKDGSLVFGPYSAIFTFVPGDVDAGSNTANFIVQRYVTPTWFTTKLIDPLTTSTEAGNITDIGDFAVGQPFSISFSREKEFVYSREIY